MSVRLFNWFKNIVVYEALVPVARVMVALVLATWLLLGIVAIFG